MPSPSVFLSRKSLVRGINSPVLDDTGTPRFFQGRFPGGRPLRLGRSAGIPDSKTFAVRTDQLSCPFSAVLFCGASRAWTPGGRPVFSMVDILISVTIRFRFAKVQKPKLGGACRSDAWQVRGAARTPGRGNRDGGACPDKLSL